MRGPLAWVVAVVAGVVLVVIVTAMIGNRDKSDETVSAGEWAQSVCGTIGVWRGELEATVEQIRTPPERGGDEEPQSETPQGRTGFVRRVSSAPYRRRRRWSTASRTRVSPTRAEGGEAAELVSDWADASLDGLEDAAGLAGGGGRLSRGVDRAVHWSCARGRHGADVGHADGRRGRAHRSCACGRPA